MKRSFLTSTILLALSGALGACGSLDAQTDSAPTIATIRGTLVNPDAVPITGALRIAVVWQGGDSYTGFNVAEDLPIEPVFPSSFTVSIDHPPPSGALSRAWWPNDAGRAVGETEMTLGTVVAYVDKNGNGKLDLVPIGASGYVDQVLATDTSHVIEYFAAQGILPTAPGVHLPYGYTQVPACEFASSTYTACTG